MNTQKMDTVFIKSEIDHVFDLQKAHALELRSSSASERIEQIRSIHDWVSTHRGEIREALYKDYRKPFTETDISEIYPVVTEARHTMKLLKEWMKPKTVHTPITFIGSKAYVKAEPKGTSLIIAPWNYPFNLAICPLISALAAGCTAIVKPSEMTPHTSALIRNMVSEIFDKKKVHVIEGGVEETQLLLAKPYDHIFFTGSPGVGKIVMKAASAHLTSVTLELGGKSPVFITTDADIKDAARKIAFTKFLNCGQTCVAPDFVFVPRPMKDAFVQELGDAILEYYVNEENGVSESSDYGRLVNERHFDRLGALIASAKEQGAIVAIGGESIADENFISPTVLTSVNASMEVMQDEIFGPILPVMEYDSLDEAIGFVNSRPKPLALYAFSKRRAIINHIFEKTSSGSAVANDCAIQFIHPDLPFGGVNNSGIGNAHGEFGFLAFSNQKAILKQRIGVTSFSPLFPPYNKTKKRIIDVLVKWF